MVREEGSAVFSRNTGLFGLSCSRWGSELFPISFVSGLLVYGEKGLFSRCFRDPANCSRE